MQDPHIGLIYFLGNLVLPVMLHNILKQVY